MVNNKRIYTIVEFDTWAWREGLLIEERFLIKKYLDKKLKTLEAGCGGGRILLEMEKMGFSSLYLFDYVPEFIEIAKQRNASKTINFDVQDAKRLSYHDASYEQIIYFQQIISFIENAEGKLKALKEAYRILKPNGSALFSFLCFEVRKRRIMYFLYLAYLKLLRLLSCKKISISYLPWLKLGGKFNFKALFDRGPYVYWYKTDEICKLLQDTGFEIIAVGTSYQIKMGIMYPSCKELLKSKNLEGMLYFVCRK